MNGREGTAENKSSLDRPAKESMSLTENREEMAKNIVKELGEKSKELKPLDSEPDTISIYILKQLFNGHVIAKEVKQKAIAHLSRRINEIQSKVRNDQALTGADRQLMGNIIEIGKDYKIPEFEFEWFKEHKPIDQTKKENISKVPPGLIKEFTNVTGTYWDKILSCALTGLTGLIGSMLKENYTLSKLDNQLKKYHLSVKDLFEFVLSFQNSAVAKAEEMIFENRKIVRKERTRYKENKNGAMDDLYKILTNTYAPKFKIADRLRAKGLIRCINSRSDLKKEYLISAPFFNNNLYKDFLRILVSTQSEEKIAEYISKFPPNTAENVALLIESFNPVTAVITPLVKPGFIREKYPEFSMAQVMDSITIHQMRAVDASKHPILNDVNTDYREMARKFQGNPKGFKDEILKMLSNREESADKTLEILYKTPTKVWELKPLIELTLAFENIKKGDNISQLIQDRLDDEGRGNTIRSVGMLAMGIGLGIAGFFTGGSAWAGLALATGGATLSGIDLYYELDNYKLHSNAAKATLGGEFSDDPGVLGITLAILSMVLDIGTLGSAIKSINRSAKLIAASKEVASTTEEASKLLKELQRTKKIGDVSEEEFVKTIQQAREGIQLPKDNDIIKINKRLKQNEEKIIEASKETVSKHINEAIGDLEVKEIIAPTTGKPIKVYTDGHTEVPIGKIEKYMRGKVDIKNYNIESLRKEISELKKLKQTRRKLFDATPQNVTRLKELEALEHNFNRSKDMASKLDSIGLYDTLENNQSIVKHLLEVGKRITPENRVDIVSNLVGPSGKLKVLTTWSIVDGKPYLSTIKLIPIK